MNSTIWTKVFCLVAWRIIPYYEMEQKILQETIWYHRIIPRIILVMIKMYLRLNHYILKTNRNAFYIVILQPLYLVFFHMIISEIYSGYPTFLFITYFFAQKKWLGTTRRTPIYIKSLLLQIQIFQQMFWNLLQIFSIDIIILKDAFNLILLFLFNQKISKEIEVIRPLNRWAALSKI